MVVKLSDLLREGVNGVLTAVRNELQFLKPWLKSPLSCGQGRVGARYTGASRLLPFFLASPYRDHFTTRRSGKILLRFGECSGLLLLIDDGIAAKHGVSAMPGDLHGDRLRNAGLDQVARGGAAEIVKDFSAVPRGYSAVFAGAGGAFA